MKIYSQDILDRADPKEVPFWYWMLHEMGEFIGALLGGLLGAVMVIIFTGSMLAALTFQFPNWTFLQFTNAVCHTSK